MRGTWREGSFTGDPERYFKPLEWVSVSIGAPLLGNVEGRTFLRDFEIKIYIKRYVKMPIAGITFHRGPVGEPGGDSLPGLFKRKGKYIWVPFLDPEDIKILSLGPSGTFVKGQGCPELISDYGAQRAHL
jgi:hypothetical protein